MILEVCANSYQSAINAEKAGAHRIELCSELSIGGVTPSYGLIEKVVNDLSIPVFVLIRPRSGIFVYSDSEFEIIKNDIKICKKLGVAGIVSGVLNSDNSVDIERTKELIELSQPLSFTFHRAFDCIPNPKETLEQLMDLGVDRILTSGKKSKAIDGIELLKELQEIAGEKLTILAGSGINSKNASQFKEVGLREIHASASKIITEQNHPFFGEAIETISDIQTIQNILKNIDE